MYINIYAIILPCIMTQKTLSLHSVFVIIAYRYCEICAIVRISISLSSHVKSRKTGRILIKFDMNFIMPLEATPNAYLFLNFLQ
jgi:hypothetical protein